MNKYKIILFDLDGTLSDSKEGITKSIQYALQKMNMAAPDLNMLQCFLGPAIQVSFAKYYGLDREKTERATSYYRERFKDKGMFENKLFPGIPELLKELKEHQKILVVATSKPTVFAEQILEYFSIDKYFDLIVGSHLDGTRTSKTEIIQFIFDKLKEHKRDGFIMIGDRKYDIIGANNTGIDSIGVTYGYGSLEELKHYNPTFIANSVNQIKDILIKNPVN
ncbi:HAD family hydrolase [Ammoniphilus sp. 3BR4]|uniref:HAD family hydrolase n=1 Tax=Ammoniphilus sp. 3BR4 TaxID=3158265 RepID=UPI00346536F2